MAILLAFGGVAYTRRSVNAKALGALGGTPWVQAGCTARRKVLVTLFGLDANASRLRR